MNKQELIANVADTSGLAKGDATKAVEAVFDAITASLKKGDEVRLSYAPETRREAGL